MEISKNILVIFALAVTFILETRNSDEYSRVVLLETHDEEHFLPHTRERRKALSDQRNYTVDITVNASDAGAYQKFLFVLNATSFPIHLDNNTDISEIGITTVCFSTSSVFKCQCAKQFAWSYNNCVKYGSCDSITSGICKCINAIPPDGQSCQPISELLAQVEYEVEVELNVTDIETLNHLRSLLINGSYFLALGPTVNVTHINITTVCSVTVDGFQCRCEDQFRWSCDQCLKYGSCDTITDGTCVCIGTIPPDGQYCQSVYQHNFTACPLIMILPSTTTPLVVYEYLITVELNTTDVTLIDRLRNVLNSTRYPILLNVQVQLSDVKFTTVCSMSNNGFQCRCEDQYHWSCDQCLKYGPCDNITNDTCGCINAFFPDGAYCRSVYQHTPPVVKEYLISVEVNTTNVTVIETLRNILSNISLPIIIGAQIQLSDINFTTVCYPNNTTYQCRCEEQYSWPCHLCSTFGKCNDVFENICGCINTIPPSEVYCQLLTELCPTTSNDTTTVLPTQNTTAIITPIQTVITAPPVVFEYLITVELNTTDVTLIDELRNILNSTTYPIVLNEEVQLSDVNFTTVCSMSSNGFQCRCEDQYHWSCDQCLKYGSCDNITDDTCGCIHVFFPDGAYCRPVYQQTCPLTTTPPPTVVKEYRISVELNATDITVIETLRNILGNISFPITIGAQIQLSDIDFTTVCYPSGSTYQCRCEEQYSWPCHLCSTFGKCNDVFENICGCINTIPPSGVYCQLLTEMCPTPPNDTTIVPTNTTTILTPTPTVITDSPPNMTTVNDTTTPTPTTIVTISDSTAVSTTNGNTEVTTALTTNVTSIIPNMTEENYTTPPTPATIVTYSIPVYTTTGNTTVTTTSTTNITNSTTVATTAAPTTVTNSTTVATTVMNATVTTPSSTTIPTTLGPIQNATPTLPTTPSRIPTTSVLTSGPTGPTPVPNITTNPTTRPTTVTTTTITTPASTPPAVINVTLSMRLDLEFTENLTDKLSPAYKNLESRINSVLEEQYSGISGVHKAFVTGFRPGSVIAEFVVQAIEVNAPEIADANNKLPDAIELSIATVLGSVVAQYTSPTSLHISDPIYTGRTTMLTCGPPDIDVGTISGSVWKFEGLAISSDRIKAITADNLSTLIVNNIIPADAGIYECTLEGTDLHFVQTGKVIEIIQAPIVRLQSKISAKCEEGDVQPLQCCVQAPYSVHWFDGTNNLTSNPAEEANCFQHDYKIENCNRSQTREEIFTCRVNELEGYDQTTTLTIFIQTAECNDTQYGTGREGDTVSARCDAGKEGEKTAQCLNGQWRLVQDTCIVVQIKLLLIGSQDLVAETVPEFVGNLSTAVMTKAAEITNSSATISAIVDIINNVANVTTVVSENIMKDVLETVDVIIGDDSRASWLFLNSYQTRNASSELLGSLETLSNELDGTFIIETQRIQLNRTMFNDSFNAMLNSSVAINIPNTSLSNVFITTIILFTLNNVMPARNSTFDISLTNATTNETVPDNAINAAVLLVKTSEPILNVTLSYNKLNDSLSLYPQCVFWNFTLFDDLGAWDDEGCMFVSDINNTVTCSCNHLTSFSILMATDVPLSIRLSLDKITYVGVGISLASLVICLIIEGCVWKDITRNSTAFMRHISIINTALSLLIANICFIIGASVAKNPLEDAGDDYTVPVGPCSTATFFIHFFYLALFFWMLVSGLLLFYRTVMVFSHMSKSTMLTIGLILGYGCPLIIAVITVAVTAPGNGYIRNDIACWLNWSETKALLALVIPALTIVCINILIVIIVLFKMLRRGIGDATQTDEKHTMVVIIRCVAILTPFFGLTWSLGVGTMISPTNVGIHIAFAFFNSLQGFFILVFGTLMDSKIRAILSRNTPIPASGSNQTRSTSGGIFSFGGLNLINRFRGRRDVYHVSNAANSSSNNSGVSETFINIHE